MTAGSSAPQTDTDVSTEAGERDLASARRVLGMEVDCLSDLARGLDQNFVAALDIAAGASGRVVVTGMGKAGHIGGKIAATLASTGTPAFYVHPAEASHGDLGMIAAGDAILAFSNSGETAELADMVAYAKRFEIPLIAVTGATGSTLARAADVVLALPDGEEACPMGLAPTTSTTAMLALGDAIAVALLERKGFSAADFKVFHPGGKLGRRLLMVRDIMHTGDAIPLGGADTRMAEALITMTAHGLGCIGIIGDDGLLLGVVTDGDLRRHMGSDLIDRSAVDIMTANAKSVGPDMHAGEALRFMNEANITNVFVVADGRPVGILHIHDCLRAGVA